MATLTQIMGLDEAGKGPVLGNLFIGGILCTQDQINFLKQNGVTDSKQISPLKRKQLYPLIKQNCIKYYVKEITIETIDKNLKKHGEKSLNDLEIEAMRDLIVDFKPDEVYIDAFLANEDKFKQELIELLKIKMGAADIPKIIAKNKADSLYTIVGAASILAKVERDALIDSYRPQFAEYGNIGSGYSSDETTIEFLKKYIIKNKQPPPIARKSWATTENLVRELVQQTKLTDFFGKK